MDKLIDPLKFVNLVWPHIKLYDKQIEIMYSVRDNDETFVPAGNQLGKDFITALTCLWFFCSRRPARVVTTSVKYDQLNDVLWGEIRRLLSTAKYNLPIQYNHMRIRQIWNDGVFVPRCELVGQCVSQNEGLLGRHLERPNGIPTTLVAFDEASGIATGVYESSDTWAHRKLIIGNPFPCSNFFFNGVQDGDLKKPNSDKYFRKVIRIRADDSPNVILAKKEIAQGKEPSRRIIIPGLIDYTTYEKRKLLWDKIRKCISLDGEFYLGSEMLLYPPDWIDASHEAALERQGRIGTNRAMGIDTAEGGDNSSWCVIDEYGIIKLVSMKTPDTSIIPGQTIALMNEFSIPPQNVCFDRGGGGKEHADLLRSQGYQVRTVAFGGVVPKEQRIGITPVTEREQEEEAKYVFKNNRAKMYYRLRQKINPNQVGGCLFAISREYTELRKQMAPIPLLLDGEGRIWLPSKNKKSPTSKEPTLIDLIGHSPDELDALVIAIHAQEGTAIELSLGMTF